MKWRLSYVSEAGDFFFSTPLCSVGSELDERGDRGVGGACAGELEPGGARWWGDSEDAGAADVEEEEEAVEAAGVEVVGGRVEAGEGSWLVFVIIGGGGPRVATLGRVSPLSVARARKLIVTERTSKQWWTDQQLKRWPLRYLACLAASCRAEPWHG